MEEVFRSYIHSQEHVSRCGAVAVPARDSARGPHYWALAVSRSDEGATCACGGAGAHTYRLLAAYHYHHNQPTSWTLICMRATAWHEGSEVWRRDTTHIVDDFVVCADCAREGGWPPKLAMHPGRAQQLLAGFGEA